MGLIGLIRDPDWCAGDAGGGGRDRGLDVCCFWEIFRISFFWGENRIS